MDTETSSEAWEVLSGLLDHGPVAVVWHEGRGCVRSDFDTVVATNRPVAFSRLVVTLDIESCNPTSSRGIGRYVVQSANRVAQLMQPVQVRSTALTPRRFVSTASVVAASLPL